jgi:hypothetical protein
VVNATNMADIPHTTKTHFAKKLSIIKPDTVKTPPAETNRIGPKSIFFISILN